VFGIVGDAISAFVSEVEKSDKLTYVHVRHEEVAAFAAGAQAQLTGQLGVCCGTSGPGGIHLINGLYDSHKSGAPILAIVGQVPTSERGTNYFQEVHLDRLFEDCSFYSETITNPDQVPRIAQLAAQNAISRRGVAVVSVGRTSPNRMPPAPA
jgi:pyruvate dehydrogenase (quinone)